MMMLRKPERTAQEQEILDQKNAAFRANLEAKAVKEAQEKTEADELFSKSEKAQALIADGAKTWAKGGHVRVYLTDAQKLALNGWTRENKKLLTQMVTVSATTKLFVK